MSSDREKIFEMVAEGIITLEEAKRLLECLSVVSEIQEEAIAGEQASAAAEHVGATQGEAMPQNEAEAQVEATAKTGTTAIHGDATDAHTKAAEMPQASATSAPEAPATPVSPESAPRVDFSVPVAPVAPEAPNPFQSQGDANPSSALVHIDRQNQYSSAAAWVKGFKISWFSGPVEIRCYDGDVVNITEYSKDVLREEDKMEITENNGIIQVKWDRHGSIFSLTSLTRLLGRLTLSKQLLVEIPRSLQGKLEVLECSTVSGKIDCTEIAAEKMNLSSTSGAVNATSLTARLLKASSVSGKVVLADIAAGDVNVNSTSGSVHADGFSIKSGDLSSVSGSVHLMGSAERLHASTVSGAVKASLDTCPQNISFDTVSGGIHVTLPDNDGFTVHYSSVSSRLDSQFPLMGSLGKKNGKATYGNGQAQIRFNTVSGGMRLYCQ